MVEYFGGWIAAGWVATASRSESGVAADPCAPRAGRRWLLPDGTTEKGQNAYVVVVNPFASEAVFSIALVTERRTVRAKQWSNFVLPGRRAAAFHLNDNALGEQTVATEIDVSIGRVAAASLGISDAGGIRSAIGMTRPGTGMVLPGAADAGPSDVALMNLGSSAARYSVSVLGSGGRRPAQDLTGQQLGPGSDRTEHVSASGAAILVQSSGPMAASRRSAGVQGDQGATSATTPAPAWLVSSPASSSREQVRLYLANPARTNVRVAVSTFTAQGATPGSTRSILVPAGTTAAFPSNVPAGSSVLAVSSDGTFVPALASYSRNGGGYAVEAGVAIPPRWVPKG
jgi:hypothetical protein